MNKQPNNEQKRFSVAAGAFALLLLGALWFAVGVRSVGTDNTSADLSPADPANQGLESLASAQSVYETMLAAAPAQISLISTLRAGDLYAALLLIESGISVEETDADGRTPLHAAAESGQHEAITRLAARGVDLNQPDRLGNTALHLAAAANDVYSARQLLRLGASADAANQQHYTPLHSACAAGAIQSAAALIRSGTDININVYPNDHYPPIYAAMEARQWQTSAWLRKQGARVSIPEMVRFADIPGLEEQRLKDPSLLERENRARVKPIHLAVLCRRMEVIRYLVEHGYAIDDQNEMIEPPLWLAVYNEAWDIAEYLISKGADPNQRRPNSNENLAHALIKRKQLDALRRCLDWGVAINTQNMHGYTPLHTAVESECFDCVALLIERGAALDIKNKNAYTPLMLAVIKGRNGMARLLIENGAD
ncbi:MAG TPA: ankyrin repeat domain-containing protein, partial [Candidatus Hydrogenedentes bacterium]|nr:ankyrin repeat domain-containing protein [Candidatus Hydrogenedentota bacterium]